ncbi:hypothetical protein OPQ81_006047 [Rhizoctonia solani]|nr:hypothetical protein OPQ81_006047 [Rhizoctonia solani]
MAVEHGENVARSSSPSIPGVTTRAHQSRWAKSWTLAALKWAFKHLGKAAKQLKGRIKSGRNGCMGPQPTSSIPRPTIAMQVAQQPRQCIVNEESYGERLYQEFKEQAHDEALLLLNKGDKTGATARNTINRLSENFLADLADKAWNRAIENMRQQDTQTNYFAEEEWRKILSTNFMLKHFPKGGLWAEEWKKEFEDIFEQAWRTSWKNAWNAAWDDAYDSIISKGIDFGIETALADPNGSHNKLYNNHRQLITRLKQVESYHQIKATIHRETISDSLKCIQSLIKDLYHLTDLLQHTAHSAHGNFVTVFALVPSTV